MCIWWLQRHLLNTMAYTCWMPHILWWPEKTLTELGPHCCIFHNAVHVSWYWICCAMGIRNYFFQNVKRCSELYLLPVVNQRHWKRHWKQWYIHSVPQSTTHLKQIRYTFIHTHPTPTPTTKEEIYVYASYPPKRIKIYAAGSRSQFDVLFDHYQHRWHSGQD